MSLNKARLAAISVSVGALVLGGAAAAAFGASTPSPSSTQSAPGSDARGSDGGRGHGPGGSQDTPVTGDEATKVKDAVKAKDSAATITEVRKDPDGSYDAIGTKNGAPVFFDVSKDLTTVTERTGGPGPGGKGGPGGMPGHQHTEVTGSEATKVGDAVKAKDSAVTVVKVFKDDDGSYAVFGTKGDSRVFFKVSKDLKTVTEQTGGPGRGPGGHGPRGGQDDDQGGAPGQPLQLMWRHGNVGGDDDDDGASLAPRFLNRPFSQFAPDRNAGDRQPIALTMIGLH